MSDEIRKVSLADNTIGAEEIAAVSEVLAGRWLSAGPVTRRFEQDFADALGVPDAVAVNSGTAALHLALLALDIGPGDEVIMPSLSFVAAAAMTVAVGAVPVFADVRSATDLTVDPADVARRITGRTRAVVAMHYAGYAADLTALAALTQRHGLTLIEDAAHAPVTAYQPDGGISVSLGGFGDVGCFSFQSSKNLTVGEGGMVVASDPAVLNRCRELRSHAMTASAWQRDRGLATDYDVTALGFNYRPTEVAAAIGRVQLSRLGADRAIRGALVETYRAHLATVPGLLLPFADRKGEDSALHLFTVVLPAGVDRAGFRDELRAAGVQTSVHYPPSHRLSFYRQRWAAGLTLPVTDAVAGSLTSLPLHARLSEQDVAYVAATVTDVLRRLGPS